LVTGGGGVRGLVAFFGLFFFFGFFFAFSTFPEPRDSALPGASVEDFFFVVVLEPVGLDVVFFVVAVLVDVVDEVVVVFGVVEVEAEVEVEVVGGCCWTVVVTVTAGVVAVTGGQV